MYQLYGLFALFAYIGGNLGLFDETSEKRRKPAPKSTPRVGRRLEREAFGFLVKAWAALRPHVLNADYLARHKWHVFVAGRRLGVPLWRLIKHDWTKVLPDEWFPYAAWFYGRAEDGTPERDAQKVAFENAWAKHYQRHDHHPEHWLVYDQCHFRSFPQEMPEVCVREMAADWIGAGMAKGEPDCRGWYEKNKDKLPLHPKTRELVEHLLIEVDSW